MHTLWQDLRFGWRMLAANKAFSIVAILTLALGVGVNSAIFSVVNAVLLRPLPYAEPERLIWVEETVPQASNQLVLGAHFLDWDEHSQMVDGIAAYNNGEWTLTGVGEPERLQGCRVSESFFPTLRTPLLLGRNILPSEDRAGGERVVILSYHLWQRRFGSDPELVGRSIRLNDEDYRVIGVLPPDFRFFLRSELWLPLALDYQQEHGNQLNSMLNVFARLKVDVTLEQAAAELETIKNSYESAEHKKRTFSQGLLHVTPLHNQLVGGSRRLLFLLLGVVALILLIACANIANLMLARAVVRQKELAIRATLGAGRFRLMRQLLTESLLLTAAGGVAGLLVAWWLTKLLAALSPPETFGQIARLATINVDGRVLSFTLLVSLLSGVLFGLAPALQFSRPDLTASLKDSGRGGLFHRQRTRQALLAGEVALAVVLLIGAGLLIRSFVNLLNVEPGFRTENLLTARIVLPYPRYENRVRREQFQQQVLERIAALPGVEHVGAINHLPLTDFVFRGWLRVEGRRNDAESQPSTPLGLVSPDYFRTLSIPLRAGRYFDHRDTADAPRVIILSESLARQLFPNEDPLNKRVWVPGPGKGTPTVVGVVGDVRHQGLDREIETQVYAPHTQNPPGRFILAVRSTVAPRSLATDVRACVQAVDPDQPLHEVMTMEERLSDSVAVRRFTLLLLGVFAGLALILAAVGVYGVISYVVTQRTHEVGIRMALGAQASDVLRLFVKQGMALIFFGLGIGLFAATVLTRVMSNLLFGVRPTDPLTFAGVALLLALVALTACWLPARRATKVDPLMALRHE